MDEEKTTTKTNICVRTVSVLESKTLKNYKSKIFLLKSKKKKAEKVQCSTRILNSHCNNNERVRDPPNLMPIKYLQTNGYFGGCKNSSSLSVCSWYYGSVFLCWFVSFILFLFDNNKFRGVKSTFLKE